MNQYRAPSPGKARNPMFRLSRNTLCICGSGKKFKKCCLKDSPRYIPALAAAKLKKALDEAFARRANGEEWTRHNLTKLCMRCGLYFQHVQHDICGDCIQVFMKRKPEKKEVA